MHGAPRIHLSRAADGGAREEGKERERKRIVRLCVCVCVFVQD